jgi:hypothetical protein
MIALATQRLAPVEAAGTARTYFEASTEPELGATYKVQPSVLNQPLTHQMLQPNRTEVCHPPGFKINGAAAGCTLCCHSLSRKAEYPRHPRSGESDSKHPILRSSFHHSARSQNTVDNIGLD